MKDHASSCVSYAGSGVAMEVCHEVKVEVMRYLDEVAAQLQHLASSERELILQQLYARISRALEDCRTGQPTVHDLHQVLAGLPKPRSFARKEPKQEESIPAVRHGTQSAVIGAAVMPFAILLFSTALMLASTTSATKLTAWEWVVMLVGFQAPVFVTMLGIAGIAGIRETQEKHGGLALAVCVTLTFPLLLLDGTLIYLASVSLRHLWHSSWLVPFTVGLVIFLLDIKIIRSVWQTVTRPSNVLG